ncbi:MAG: type II secretion system F family protein [Candidatus Falkowbacteria bacterium]|nr:type II secretion system F family protein [Candidatus Falkowbacteria bacterium]
MPTFNFKAANPVSDRQESGTIEAANEAQAIDTLASRGLQIISLKELSLNAGWSANELISRVTTKDIVSFSRQFSVMVGASVPVVESLKVLSKQITKPKLRKIVAEIGDEVDSGGNLSTSLAKHPKIFSNFYTSVVKSGEQSGKLDDSLNYIADEMEKDYDMNSKIKGAMIYPIFVICMMIGIGFLMMMFIVPKLTQIVIETGSELPAATKTMIAISDFLNAYWWTLLIGAGALAVAIKFYLKTKPGRLLFDHIILNMPIFGILLQMICLVRFTRSMNTLIIGGVNISTSLQVAGEVVDNAYYKKIIDDTIIEVQSGNSICTIFVKTKEIPNMVSQMMLVGEKTGKLDVSLEKVTNFYNREITNMLANMMSLIEPVLMVTMGLGVGVMVWAILMPMYSVVSNI